MSILLFVSSDVQLLNLQIPFTNCAINPVRGTVWNVVTDKADAETLVYIDICFLNNYERQSFFKYNLSFEL